MASNVELDEYDRKILRALQENADFSMADLGNLIGLSHTPCWRRLKRLETEGVIRGKVTLLDAKKLTWECVYTPSLALKITMRKR